MESVDDAEGAVLVFLGADVILHRFLAHMLNQEIIAETHLVGCEVQSTETHCLKALPAPCGSLSFAMMSTDIRNVSANAEMY